MNLRTVSMLFREVIQDAREQKFTGAAADLLNANIIARDLGLKDNVSNEHTGANGGAIKHEISETAADKFASILNDLTE